MAKFPHVDDRIRQEVDAWTDDDDLQSLQTSMPYATLELLRHVTVLYISWRRLTSDIGIES